MAWHGIAPICLVKDWRVDKQSGLLYLSVHFVSAVCLGLGLVCVMCLWLCSSETSLPLFAVCQDLMKAEQRQQNLQMVGQMQLLTCTGRSISTCVCAVASLGMHLQHVKAYLLWQCALVIRSVCDDYSIQPWTSSSRLTIIASIPLNDPPCLLDR
jgi:hypothetical protein